MHKIIRLDEELQFLVTKERGSAKPIQISIINTLFGTLLFIVKSILMENWYFRMIFGTYLEHKRPPSFSNFYCITKNDETTEEKEKHIFFNSGCILSTIYNSWFDKGT